MDNYQNPIAAASPKADAGTLKSKVLLTGATGYIGGRLAPRLLDAGYRVRCLVRSAKKLARRPWADHPGIEVVEGDLRDSEQLVESMRGCEIAYYLIHSMQVAGREYAERDRVLAANFAHAAEEAGVRRIIYLGGLGELGDGLSRHLASRREVETILASFSVPVTVFRAAMIIGSGSASFEILRYLTERLPVMITPRWVSTECQPIAVRDVLGYLVKCLSVPQTIGETLDIGGPDVLTYRDLIHFMAEALTLHRRIIVPVPFLTPRLSSVWIHLVTPISGRMARPLAEGLRNRVVCRNDRALQLMPQALLSAREAIEQASARPGAKQSEPANSQGVPGDPHWAGGTVLRDRREIWVNASADKVFRSLCRLGGSHGYYSVNWLWRLRGSVDSFFGGSGLKRERRHPECLAIGDCVDFWRVTEMQPPHRLRFQAEMKLPGEAELEFTIRPDLPSGGRSDAGTRLVQIARFRPRGLGGLIYWYAVVPLHWMAFRGMLAGIRRDAEKRKQHDSH
jgi:uncharacterized protein YbjT (DUF2867 family)